MKTQIPIRIKDGNVQIAVMIPGKPDRPGFPVHDVVMWCPLALAHRADRPDMLLVVDIKKPPVPTVVLDGAGSKDDGPEHPDLARRRDPGGSFVLRMWDGSRSTFVGPFRALSITGGCLVDEDRKVIAVFSGGKWNLSGDCPGKDTPEKDCVDSNAYHDVEITVSKAAAP